MANTQDLIQYQNPLFPLLTSILGGEQGTNVSKGGTTTQDTTSSTTGTSNQAVTGTSSQQQTGTSTQQTSGTSLQQTNADTSRLADVYARQYAGITPDMLSAIFREGSRQIPGITAAYANAVGARSADNSPLATALRDMQIGLTDKAAQLNFQLLKDSGITAQQIADLTKSVSTTNDQTTTGTNTSNTVGSNQQNTVGTNTSNTTAAQTGTNQELTNIDQKSTVNTDALKILAGLGIGGSVLDSLLPGGMRELAKVITGGGGGVLQKLFGGTQGVVPGDAMFGTGGLFSNLAGDQTLNDLFSSGDWWNQDFTGGLGDLGFDSFAGTSIDSIDNIDWNSVIGAGDWMDLGFADGGSVEYPKERGAAYANGGGVAPGRSLKDYIGERNIFIDKNLAKPAAGFTDPFDAMFGANNSNNQAWQTAVNDAGQYKKDWQTQLGNWKGTLPDKGREYDQLVYNETMKRKKQFAMGKALTLSMIGAMAGGAGAYALGGAGAGAGSAGAAGSAGSPGAVGSSFAATTNGSFSNWLQQAAFRRLISTLIGRLGKADGGYIRKEPKVGTMGPKRIGSGSGGLSKDSVLSAMDKKENDDEESKKKEGRKNLPFNTTRALKEHGEYADGGSVEGTPLEEMVDSEGIEDTVQASLSVGEYVVPTDTVDALGKDFFDYVKDKYHTPVEMQKAMGFGG